jgi:S1-C subfamily serine protease
LAYGEESISLTRHFLDPNPFSLIHAGNSGGPLLDSFGRIIGVNTATFTRAGTGMSSGVNFAVPIDAVRLVVPRLIVFGTSLPQTSLTERMAAPSLPAAREGVAENLYK